MTTEEMLLDLVNAIDKIAEVVVATAIDCRRTSGEDINALYDIQTTVGLISDELKKRLGNVE